MANPNIPSLSGNHRDLLRWLTGRQPEMIASVREMVVRESPTGNKPACDDLCSYLAREFERLGGRVKIHRQGSAGNHLQVDFSGGKGRKPVLLLGHFDTVYDVEHFAPCHGASRTAGSTGPAFSI